MEDPREVDASGYARSGEADWENKTIRLRLETSEHPFVVPFDPTRLLINEEGTILVHIGADGTVHVATRPDRSATWSPPQVLKDAP